LGVLAQRFRLIGDEFRHAGQIEFHFELIVFDPVQLGDEDLLLGRQLAHASTDRSPSQ